MNTFKLSLEIRLLPLRLVVIIMLLGSMSAVQNTFGKDRTSVDAQSDLGIEFRVLVPEFTTDSDETGSQLGYSVTFALEHEIFRTFSISIPFREDGRFDQRDSCCLRNDAVAIFDFPLSHQTHDMAFRRAMGEQAQLVLWGKAWPYGTDVVVQPFLTVAHPPQNLRHTPESMAIGIGSLGQDQWQWLVWQITAEGVGGSSVTVRLTEFPSLQYEMSPIVFDSAKLKLFDSFEGMPVYKEKSVTSKQEGTTGNEMHASEHAPGGWTRIRQPKGWIKLPNLDAEDTVEYVGGLVHFMRGNWKRARISFERVTQAREAPTQIRRDAALLLAASLFRLDETCAKCDEPIKFAENLNPYSRITAKYGFMASLARAKDSSDTEVWQDVRNRLDRIRSFEPEDDLFVKNAHEVLEALQNQSGALPPTEP